MLETSRLTSASPVSMRPVSISLVIDVTGIDPTKRMYTLSVAVMER